MSQQLDGAEELHPLTAEELKEVERRLREYVASKKSSARRTTVNDKQRSTDMRSGRDDEVVNSNGPRDDS